MRRREAEKPFAPGMYYWLREGPDPGTFDLHVVSDPHGDPMGAFQVGRVGGFVGPLGADCKEYARAFEAEQTELDYWRSFQVYKAYLDEEYRGGGLGTRMYELLMAELFDRLGPFMFAPGSCTAPGATSFDAQPVWTSLARRYPAKGFGQKQLRSGATYVKPGVIAVLERPEVAPHPRRDNRLKRRLMP